MLMDGLTDGRTHGRTDDGRKVIIIAHPEQSSGELKTKSTVLPFTYTNAKVTQFDLDISFGAKFQTTSAFLL